MGACRLWHDTHPLQASLDDFTVANVAEMDECGLWKATRFRLDRVALLPWSSEFFIAAAGRETPVMGRLSEHAVQLLRHQAAARRVRLARQGKLDLD